MGFFKDLRSVKKQAEAMTPQEYRGLAGSMRMAKDGMAQMNEALGGLADYQQKVQHLNAVGRPGTATVTAIRQTGTMINENPECDIDLQVVVDGGPPYAATVRQTIAMIAIPSFQPGKEVPVKVDPQDPSSLIIA